MFLLTTLPVTAAANGRMPGANDVVFDPNDPQHVLLRATFGLVQSFDSGRTWQWVCEQSIGTSGVVADPPIAILSDGTIVLLPPNGGALLSRDVGCSWSQAPAPLTAERGVDLTLDPHDSAHLLVLTSTLDDVDDAGFGTYRNLLIETRDSGGSWRVLASLPTDFEAETVEIAPSDRARLYVSGTASMNPRLGIVQRSEDAGASWTRSTLELPAGTGSLLISAVDHQLADRLWLRAPGRGDTLGLLPTRLYVSNDKGQSASLIASTRRGMLGFALSPDGTQLAYGGPSDGLQVGLSDSSAQLAHMSSPGVRCLRWNESGTLYACGTEPADSFSLGVSHDRGASFESLYALAFTCPQTCAAGPTTTLCQEAWQTTQPFIGASPNICIASGANRDLDAGVVSAGRGAGGSLGDAAAQSGSITTPAPAPSGCSCQAAGMPRAQAGLALSFWLTVKTRLRARRSRRRGVS
jgi:photosystem II stability/assembly factor-like uncharacterized protein